jgi:hypothetical protein
MKIKLILIFVLFIQFSFSQEFKSINEYNGFIPAEFDTKDYADLEKEIYKEEQRLGLEKIQSERVFSTLKLLESVKNNYDIITSKLAEKNLLKTPIDLKDFNYTKTEVYVQKKDGKINGFGVTDEKGAYKVIYIFQNYKIINKQGSRYRYGIAIAIKADIFSNKKGVDLNSLFQLAASASKSRIEGNLSLEAIGFHSQSVYTLMNINPGIDEATVQQTIKNAGILIAELNDSEITLNPVILGREKSVSK